MHIKSTLIGFLSVFSILFALPLAADSNNSAPGQIAAALKRAAFTPSAPASTKNSPSERLAQEQETIVFTAPPRESADEAQEIYQPIAEYLSRVIGKKVVYKNVGTWG